jgi:hypothetical protein
MDAHADDGQVEEDETHKTVGLEEIVLVYPPSLGKSEEEVRKELIESMMRSKSKAQKEAVLATSLLPITAAVDILATIVWPFGGLLEIDSVWAYSSIRGAKTAHSVTKRLTSSSEPGQEDGKLKLRFVPSERLEVLRAYLAAKCVDRDPHLFGSPGVRPTETEVLSAIGWSPSQVTGEERNWEDEQWETSEVRDDLKNVMGKAAKTWDKWCRAYEKDPEKALKK